ncbi:MAG: hypothetical protein JKX70_06685 [Phycisphaerales bacterium]|nr:hypothetical protein [Phycisphaerales bacterium]
MADRQLQGSNNADASTAHHKHGIVVAGLDRPELVDEMLGKYSANESGFSVAIYVLESDQGIVDACTKIQSEQWASRVRVFGGERCVDDFLDACRGQLDYWLPRHIVASGQRAVGIAQRAASGLDGVVKEQAQKIDDLRATLAQRWDERGIGHWQERFSAIASGEKARVLVVTTRHSSFMGHSATDLVESFNAIGHDARTLMEPSSHTGMTAIHTLGTIDAFDPDLIVVINYPRAMHSELFPEGWAHVCWVQDAMGHLYQPTQSKPGILDFVAGHIYAGAQMIQNFDAEAMLEFPVPVSETKFHDGQVSDAESEKYACDIAYVSHQSQTVELFHREFVSQIAGGAQQEAFARCRQMVEDAMDRWCDEPGYQPLIRARDALVTNLGREGDASLGEMLNAQYIKPLAERIIRHQTLEWASEIAQEHDLDFRIYGKGWEKHPTLSEYAKGEIPHDDQLRACYQAAKVHLHASVNGCGHQRVFECMLSGGLVLCRRSWNELYIQEWIQINEFMNLKLPTDACLVDWKHPAYVIANHPQLERAIAYRLRLKRKSGGWDHEAFEHVYADFGTDNVHACGDVELSVYAHILNADGFNYYDAPIPPRQMRPIETLGDPLELTFSTKADLEERILRAVNDGAWRRERSENVAGRVRARVSMDQFAKRLLGLVGDRLSVSQQAQAADSVAGSAL